MLAYCYYNVQDYLMAAECYSKLSDRFPNHSEYRLYNAQSLYNAFLFSEAVIALSQVLLLLFDFYLQILKYYNKWLTLNYLLNYYAIQKTFNFLV